MEIIQGNYKCARHRIGVVATSPRLGQTEGEFLEEALRAAEDIQRVCNQIERTPCSQLCDIQLLRTAVEKRLSKV